MTRILLFLTLITISSKAQLLIGPAAGAQYSWVSFSDKFYKDIYKVTPVWGFHAGAQVSFRVHKRFFLHTSFLYSRKGKVVEGIADFSKLPSEFLLDKLTATYNYFEMPIIYTVEFRAKTKSGKMFKWYMGGGPNISYWINGKGTVVNGETRESYDGEIVPYTITFYKAPGDVSQHEMVVEDPNRLQLGLNLMVGLVFEPVPNQEVMLSLRYEVGHSNLSPESSGEFYSTLYEDYLQTRNNGPRVTLSYLFDTKINQRKRGKSTIKNKRSAPKHRRRR